MTQDVINTASNWTRILLSAFFSRMRLVLLVTLLCAITVGAISYLLPAVYSGNFSILITSPEFDRSAVGEHADISLRPGSIGGNVISDEYHILRSEGLANTVATAYVASNPVPEGYLRAILPDWVQPQSKPLTDIQRTKEIEALSTFFLDKVIVSPELKSDIIKVRMTFHDRDQLLAMLELYASEYLDYRKQIWFNQEAQHFFGEQANKSLSEWRALSDELLALKARLHKIDPALEKKELEGQVSTNLGRLQIIQVQLDQYSEQLAALEELNSEDAITFFDSQTRDNRLFWQLKTDIGEAKARRQELLKDHLPASPLVQKANLQLEGLYGEYKNLVHSLIRNSIGMLKTERDALIKNNRRGSDRILDLEQIKQRIDILQKRKSLFEKQYEAYENKAMSIEVEHLSHNALGTSVRIVSPPTVRITPVWPNHTALVVIAAILGFFLALIAVVLLWMVHDAFHFPEDVTGYLGVPVLTSFVLEGPAGNPPEAPPRTRPRLPSAGRLNLVLPGSRSTWYSALIFGSMLVSGWIIGSTMWPVWQQSHPAGITEWLPRLDSLFETLSRKMEPPVVSDDSAGDTAEIAAPEEDDPQEVQLAVFGLIPKDEPPAEPGLQLPELGEAGSDVPVADEHPAEKTVLATMANAAMDPKGAVAPDLPADTAKELPAVPETNDANEGSGSLPEEMPATAETTRKPAGKATKPSGYFVQFGSFQEKRRATALRDKLVSRGYEVRVPTIANHKSERKWYSVRADFADLAAAQRARDEYLAREGIKPILGKHPRSSAKSFP